MEFLETTGIDVSKNTIDVALHKAKLHHVFQNNPEGFMQMIKWIEKTCQINKENILFGLEHTGLYSYNLTLFLHDKSLKYAILPGLEIKYSLGITRGKNDKVDAKRIAQYCYEKREVITVSTPESKEITKLKKLLSLRERVVKQRAGYKANLKEITIFLNKKDNKILFSSQESILKQLTKQIVIIDKAMLDIIEESIKLKEQYQLLTSIKGVGKQVALNMIVMTEGFTKFKNWRKFASFSGIAPFPNSSGTSIRGKTKVSNLANKKIKSLLDLSAKSAIQFNKEMKMYYESRVEKGKPKMSAVNAVRNKIVARMFAVIERKTAYVDFMKYAA